LKIERFFRLAVRKLWGSLLFLRGRDRGGRGQLGGAEERLRWALLKCIQGAHINAPDKSLALPTFCIGHLWSDFIAAEFNANGSTPPESVLYIVCVHMSLSDVSASCNRMIFSLNKCFKIDT